MSRLQICLSQLYSLLLTALNHLAANTKAKQGMVKCVSDMLKTESKLLHKSGVLRMENEEMKSFGMIGLYDKLATICHITMEVAQGLK